MEVTNEPERGWKRVEARDMLRRQRTRRGFQLLYAVTIMAGLLAIRPGGGWGTFAWNVLLLCVVWSASVLAHELGHVLVAKAGGLEPVVLLVGGGPSLVLRRHGSIAVDIGVLPGEGLTVIGAPSVGAGIKRCLLACYAAGPLTTLVLLLVGLTLTPRGWELLLGKSSSFDLGTALFFANAAILFGSLVPLPQRSGVFSPPNDLLQMLSLPGRSPEQLAALTRVAQNAEMLRLIMLRRYREACEEAHRQLRFEPENWLVRTELANLLLLAGQYAEARAEYEALVAARATWEPAAEKVFVGCVLNNLAWALYMLDVPAELPRADALSAEALSLAPKHASLLGTRGAVLVALGRAAEGRELLERAGRLHRDPGPRATNFACRALALAAEGKRRKGERLVRRARRLDRDCELLQRATDALRSA